MIVWLLFGQIMAMVVVLLTMRHWPNADYAPPLAVVTVILAVAYSIAVLVTVVGGLLP